MKYFLTLLLCCPMIASASETILSLSFAQAEQLWHNKNRELQLAHNQLRGAAADQVIAAQKPNPTLAFNTTAIATGQTDFMKQADSVLRVEQLFERGDKRSLRIREADLRTEAARADFADSQRQGIIDLGAHYYDLVLAQEQLHIAEEYARLFRQSVTAAQLRMQAGDLATADVARLQVDALRAENDVESAKNLQLQALLALMYRIGADPDTTAPTASDHWPEVQSLTTSTSTAAIVAQRPDIIAADQRVAAAEAAFAQAQALRTRDVTVGVQVEHNGQNRPLNTVGLGFSVPLMTGYAYAGEITHARIDLESAQRIAEQTRALAYVEIGNARGDLAATQAQVERFDGQLLLAARRALDAAELGYRHGAIALMDLLDARRTFKSTQIDAATAHANYAKALMAWRTLATQSDIDSTAHSNRVAIEENE